MDYHVTPLNHQVHWTLQFWDAELNIKWNFMKEQFNMTDLKKIQMAFLIKAHAKESNLLRNEKDIIDKYSALFRSYSWRADAGGEH